MSDKEIKDTENLEASETEIKDAKISENLVEENEISEQLVEPSASEETEVKEEKKVEENFEVVDKNPSIGKRIFATFLDQAILFGFSIVVLLIFSLIISLFGYEVVMPEVMILIAYVVMNILYVPLFERNGGKTIGKRILAIV